MSKKIPYTNKEKYIARQKTNKRIAKLIKQSKQKHKGKKYQEEKKSQALKEILGCSEEEYIKQYNSNKKAVLSGKTFRSQRKSDYKLRGKRKAMV